MFYETKRTFLLAFTSRSAVSLIVALKKPGGLDPFKEDTGKKLCWNVSTTTEGDEYCDYLVMDLKGSGQCICRTEKVSPKVLLQKPLIHIYRF